VLTGLLTGNTRLSPNAREILEKSARLERMIIIMNRAMVIRAGLLSLPLGLSHTRSSVLELDSRALKMRPVSLRLRKRARMPRCDTDHTSAFSRWVLHCNHVFDHTSQQFQLLGRATTSRWERNRLSSGGPVTHKWLPLHIQPCGHR
jgi:hypothetical protein